MLAKSVSCLLFASFYHVLGGHWDYEPLGSHGPKHWHGECGTGQAQSPIDLTNPEPVTFPAFKFFGYERQSPCNLVNTGHSLKFVPTGHESFVSQGGLDSDFVLAQVRGDLLIHIL